MGSEDEGSESEVSDDDEDEEKRALLEKLLNAEIKTFVKMVIDPATQILVNINEPVKFLTFRSLRPFFIRNFSFYDLISDPYPASTGFR